MPKSTKIRTIESRLASKVNKSFKKGAIQISRMVATYDFKSWQKKTVEDLTNQVESVLTVINAMIVNDIVESDRQSFKTGYDYISNTLKTSVSWKVINTEAVNYLNKVRELHLSDKDGSIDGTTKTRIIEIITQGLKQGTSPQNVAKEIIGQTQAGVFSQARAEMIAIRETGAAYETGKRVTVKKETQSTGKEYKKKWITVGDERVTPTHRQNERDGWIGFNDLFSGTSDQTAPASDNPRCRCSVRYSRIY